jgi:hypothetical protein
MKPLLVSFVAVAGLAIAVPFAVTRQANSRDTNTVYSVAALRARLDRQPGAWVEQAVLVRAVAGRCIDWVGVQGSTCVQWSQELLDADASRADVLPLVIRPMPPLQAFLRRLPLMGRLVPTAPVVYWGVTGVYQVQLIAAPARSCSSSTCFEALLLDEVA